MKLNNIAAISILLFLTGQAFSQGYYQVVEVVPLPETNKSNIRDYMGELLRDTARLEAYRDRLIQLERLEGLRFISSKEVTPSSPDFENGETVQDYQNYLKILGKVFAEEIDPDLRDTQARLLKTWESALDAVYANPDSSTHERFLKNLEQMQRFAS